MRKTILAVRRRLEPRRRGEAPVDDWKPTSGQVALIELGPDDATCLTGVVLDTDGTLMFVDLGASARPFEQTCDVTVSVFDPDALYRIEATLLPHDGRQSVVDLK